MSDEGVIFYAGSVTNTTNDWEDNDDLQTLMHAAADADARDNQLNQETYAEPEDDVEHPPLSTSVTASVSPTPSDDSEHITININKKRKPETRTDNDQCDQSPKLPRSAPKRKSDHDDSYGKRARSDPAPSGQKRKLEHSESPPKRFENEDGSGSSRSRPEGHANVVAAHYNTLEDKGLDERLKSRIFYMRNFNNWIKSMLINEYLNKVKDAKRHNSPVNVMDMCCGKGGDLLKWRKGNISYLICTDIASVSLEQCESRYREMCSRSHRDRNAGRIYKAEFIPADSTKVRLRQKYADPSIKLDLVSCQFAFHYSFESLPQAECMLRNAAECLQQGGYFIGTIPDANDIVARRARSASNTFGNDVYQISFDDDADTHAAPALFGAKYNFHLEGVVDCPEFLVHFRTFVKLAKKFGLQLVKMERFDEFYQRMKCEGAGLLQKMQCLETYPPYEGNELLGTDSNDYKHALHFLEKRKQETDPKIGTLSKSEWEAASLYLTFAFRKVKTTLGANGEPQYEFT